MATPLPEHAQTLRGQVMHSLQKLADSRKTPPSLYDSRKLTAAHSSGFGLTAAVIEAVAQAAIRDWRATVRAGEMDQEKPLKSAYLKNAPSSGVIGVRVLIDITYPGATPPGAKLNASILVNASPTDSPADVIARAMAAWNEHTVNTTHGHRSGGKATGGAIIQVVEGGYSHAQI